MIRKPLTKKQYLYLGHLTFIPVFRSLGGRAIPHWIGGGHAVLINHLDAINEIRKVVEVFVGLELCISYTPM